MVIPNVTNFTEVTQEVLHFVQKRHAEIVTKQEDISYKMKYPEM